MTGALTVIRVVSVFFIYVALTISSNAQTARIEDLEKKLENAKREAKDKNNKDPNGAADDSSEMKKMRRSHFFKDAKPRRWGSVDKIKSECGWENGRFYMNAAFRVHLHPGWELFPNVFSYRARDDYWKDLSSPPLDCGDLFNIAKSMTGRGNYRCENRSGDDQSTTITLRWEATRDESSEIQGMQIVALAPWLAPPDGTRPSDDPFPRMPLVFLCKVGG